MQVRLIEPKETYPLRHQVLRPGLPLESAIFPADTLPGSFHVGAFDDLGGLMSVATFQKEGHGDFKARYSYRLRGMATAAAVQGKGFGAGIISFSFAHLQKLGCDFSLVQRARSRLRFLRKIGISLSRRTLRYSRC